MRLFLRLLLLAFFGVAASRTFAQTDSLPASPRLRISLLTCGPGAEIYSVFGHTAVRITDSAAGTDIVYNYGTFDGYDEQFELNFMRGKLLYYLSEDYYEDFVASYAEEQRWVDEQVLRISPEDKKAIQVYLTNNLKPENRAYKYDFFFDNCATRIRDIFQDTHGASFRFAQVAPAGRGLSFRQIINRYLAGNPWERLGINMLLGSRIDKVMSNSDIMFLPDYLEDAVAGATLKGQVYAAPPERLVKASWIPSSSLGVQPVLWSLFALLVAALFIPLFRPVGSLLSSVILLLSALLGILMLFMWLGTDHQGCAYNYNVLWALPTNLLYVFKRKQTKYALVAIIAIFICVLIHIAGVQGLLLPDMIPVLLMLLTIFAVDYRKYQNKR